MWIRSQNKEYLLKVNCLLIQKDSVFSDPTVYKIIEYDKGAIAEYSTKGKALKVLDMIQEFIKGQKESFYAYKDNKEIVNHYYYPNKEQLVFQMPQDDEVE